MKTLYELSNSKMSQLVKYVPRGININDWNKDIGIGYSSVYKMHVRRIRNLRRRSIYALDLIEDAIIPDGFDNILEKSISAIPFKIYTTERRKWS